MAPRNTWVCLFIFEYAPFLKPRTHHFEATDGD